MFIKQNDLKSTNSSCFESIFQILGFLLVFVSCYGDFHWPDVTKTFIIQPKLELELELIQTQMAQKPMLRAEVYARAFRASQNLKRAEV